MSSVFFCEVSRFSNKLPCFNSQTLRTKEKQNKSCIWGGMRARLCASRRVASKFYFFNICFPLCWGCARGYARRAG